MKIIGAKKTKRYSLTEDITIKSLYQKARPYFGSDFDLYMCTNSVWMVALDPNDDMKLHGRLVNHMVFL